MTRRATCDVYQHQPSLFDSTLPEAQALRFTGTTSKVVWSYSRRQLMNQCLLSYYYRYYGASRRTAAAEPLKERLRFLKSLSNRYLRTGSILHLVIKTYFKHRRAGKVLSAQWARDWAMQLYERDLVFSRRFQGIGESASTDQSSPALLAEFYYGSPRAEAECEESRQKLLTAIGNFFSSPSAKTFILGGADGNAITDERRFVLKTEGFDVEARPDLVFRSNGQRIVIADWKIGGTGSSEDSLQLLAYSLVVTNAIGCGPDDLDLFLVHLGDGAAIRYQSDQSTLTRARVRILQDVEKMKMMDEFGRAADSEAFTPCGRPRVCANCVFREVCPVGAHFTESQRR